MTREEAIQWLKVINTKEFAWDEFALQESQREIRERCEQGVREAIDMAIEALQADITQGIGRYENAMQKLREMPKYLNGVKAKQIKKISTEAAQGEWIKHEGKWVDFDFYPTKYECNQCHYCIDEGYDSVFCPNCGARMKRAKND